MIIQKKANFPSHNKKVSPSVLALWGEGRSAVFKRSGGAYSGKESTTGPIGVKKRRRKTLFRNGRKAQVVL